ncbi:MAG TPA: HesA/MoeB/ThiF family protein [Candidatus Acidoferrales bacterium]|nr:HesA/MoeB/ThiF family protein [Candidatus Acidoferrales bacterium]
MPANRTAGSRRLSALADMRVLVVGVGGLGCPAAIALAAAGVGTIGLVDPDKVELSNLPRQTLYNPSHIGQLKVEIAAGQLQLRFPGIRLRQHCTELTASTFAEITSGYQFAIDATDQGVTKFLMNDQCVSVGMPLVHAGVVGFDAQLMTIVPGSSCLRCLFPQPPENDDAPACRESGVLGGIVGCFGYLQAAEAIAYLLNEEPPRYTNRLLTYDGGRARWHVMSVPRASDCASCGLGQPSTGSRPNETRI